MPPDTESGDDPNDPPWGRVVRPQPNATWDAVAEQRLQTLYHQVRKLEGDIGKLRDKQGAAENNSRENGWKIERVAELVAGVDARLKSIQDLIPDKRRAELVEKVVFGLVGLILVAVVGLWLKTIGIGR